MSNGAVNLLLRVMETRTAKVQIATLKQVAPQAVDKLLESKLLVASGQIPIVAAMDSYEDEPIPTEWCAARRQHGYHDSVGRWVPLDAGDISACAVDYPLVVAKLLLAFERAGPPRPAPLIDGIAWDVGTIKLSGMKAPVPVWFARRLADPAIWAKAQGLFMRRPPEEVRIILTSTPGDRIPINTHKRNHVISVADVIKNGKLAISPQVLKALVFPGQVQRRFPIDHSDDYGIVWLRGETLTFRSDKQRQLLGMLFDPYWSGSPVCRTAAVLFEAGYKDGTNALAKVFSGRDDWRSFIKYAEGNCWIEP